MTFLNLDSMGPIKMIEDLISTARASGISVLFRVLESIITTLFSLFTLHPMLFNISSVASTSLRRGQFFITLMPPLSTVATRIGNTAFFAPSTVISPDNFCPPVTISLSTFKHLRKPRYTLVLKSANHIYRQT